MKLKSLSLLVFITILFIKSQLFAQPCKEVIAYYPNWQWYDRNHLVNPLSIDYSKYTIINYSFFSPQADGSINQTDTWADENLLLGQHDWVNGGYLPNTSLIDIAHNNGVKVMVSIGGWTLSNNFPGISASASKRTVFASSCVSLLSTYGFDGIDIDWEYPGYAEHNGTPADSSNFTLLLQEIRDSIDTYGLSIGQDMLLSSCFSADPDNMIYVQWSSLAGILDMFNLMTYDFFGAFSPLSNHNSPLYAPAVGNPDFNINAAFLHLTQQYGVPSSMVNIGVPFYGRSVTSCTGLHQANSGSPDYSTFSDDDGSPTYYNVMKNISMFSYYWDNLAMVPYLLGNTISTFVSYDDEHSVALKADYALNHGARGVIIWELTGDYIETSQGSGIIAGTPLVDTLNQVLCSIPVGLSELVLDTDSNVFIWPNPAKLNDIIHLNYYSNNSEVILISLFSIDGQLISQKEFHGRLNQSYSLQLNLKNTGLYFLRLNSSTQTLTWKLAIE